MAESEEDSEKHDLKKQMLSQEDLDEIAKKLLKHQIGRAHVWTPVTPISRMPSSAWKKKKKQQQKKKTKKQHTYNPTSKLD